jgi:hypothetical protein
MQTTFPFLESRPPKQKAGIHLDTKIRIEALHVLSRMIVHAGKQKLQQEEKNND